MTYKSNDYKLSAVNYYLVEDKTQEEVCKIFKCSRRSLMRWVERYKKDGNVDIHYRKPVAYKVKKEYVDFLLQELKKNKTYTYFKPKYILYATYLSEKIGYARYITIFRQLEKNPDKRFHPIFRWFERWCNDEFRHGESFALIMRADPKLLQGTNLLFIRFFLLAVYATMYVRDHTRPALKHAMGLDPTRYDYEVFRITSEISKQVCPISLDIDSPTFRQGMNQLFRIAEKYYAAREKGGVISLIQQGGYGLAAFITFVGMYFIPVKHHHLPMQIRVAAAW